MNQRIDVFIPINGNKIPLIYLNGGRKSSVPAINEKSSNLIEEVEKMAKQLKREDYNQLVLTKDEVNDSSLILNIVRYFEEEDVEVIGLWVDKITDEAKETLSEELKYGIITYQTESYDNPKYLKKKL